MKIKLTYDGKGLNDANDEYKTRILTFVNDSHDIDRDALGRLLAAAPELYEACKNALELLDAHKLGQHGTAPYLRHAIKKADSGVWGS